ncbi:MAG: filamentous hemagglutinin N-terminal domain-containing protein, partial [Burkholderiaceae bacterium]
MTLARFVLTALTAALMTAFGSQAHALPVGGNVSAGAATIVNGPATTTIHQTTPNAAINWNSFSIGSAEAVHFVQPSSSAVALNRVVGADPSNILGTLSANGKVFLINPNGILFGKGASVNVAGLVASTLNVSDGDFMAGRYKFSGSGGSVVNQGSIDANGGYVALLGANVSNQGTISARMGTVALAAGDAITLDVAGDGLINVAVDRGAVSALVDNGGMIRADGGQVVMTAQSAGHLLGTVVNHTGVIEAGSISQRNGIVRLEADTVHVAGTINSRGAAGETGGTVSITGATVDVAPTATIDASGGAGGGVIAVGGGWQGTGPLAHATTVGVAAGAKLLANATDAGDGGTISVWSDGTTKV